MKRLLTLTLSGFLAMTPLAFAQNATVTTGATVNSDANAGNAGLNARATVDPRETWKTMTPEQRQQAIENANKRHAEKRAEWQSKTPEERAAARAEAKAKWDNATPEQKAAWKEKRQDWREKRKDWREQRNKNMMQNNGTPNNDINTRTPGNSNWKKND